MPRSIRNHRPTPRVTRGQIQPSVMRVTRMAPKVEGPKMAPMMKPRMMLIMARMIVPAQYLARLMRPSNDVKRYWKSKFIASPPFAAGVRRAPPFFLAEGGLAEGGGGGGDRGGG